MEAITFGVPMLVVPVCNDQFHQAHFTRRAGIGRTIDLDGIRVEDLAIALEELIGPGPIRDRMHTVSRSYAVDGAAQAARLVLALAR
jgi:UDP:flavonoid glycosyltransferase YjiC (YdhE family)